MDKKDNVPKIRFPGFTEPWEQRKLEDGSYKIGDGLHGTPKYSENGNVFFVNGNNLINGKIVFTEETKRVTEEEKTKDDKLLNENTILISINGTIGNLALYQGENIMLGKSAAYITVKDFNRKFIYSYLQNQSILTHFMNNLTGTTIKNLGLKTIRETEVFVPSIDEQKKIGDLFNNLDNLISLHQRKLDDLKKQKKGLLQKMFPKNGEKIPEIRFPGFTEPWEQRKWSDTVDISKEMVDPRSGEYDELPHVAPGNIEPFTGQLYDNIKLVKDENLISGKFHFHKGDIIYGKINPQLGKYIFAGFEGLTSADAYVLNSKNGIEQTYLFTILQTKKFYNYTVSVSKRSGMPKINRDELNAYSFLAPSEEEQLKIGHLFLKLDKFISLHQREHKFYIFSLIQIKISSPSLYLYFLALV